VFNYSEGWRKSEWGGLDQRLSIRSSERIREGWQSAKVYLTVSDEKGARGLNKTGLAERYCCCHAGDRQIDQCDRNNIDKTLAKKSAGQA